MLEVMQAMAQLAEQLKDPEVKEQMSSMMNNGADTFATMLAELRNSPCFHELIDEIAKLAKMQCEAFQDNGFNAEQSVKLTAGVLSRSG